ncbi:MAG: hypothetical protein AB1414_01145 [bacterium]
MARRRKKRGRGKISKATALAEAHRKVMRRTKVGTGKRFASLKAKLKKKKGVRTPGALAAWIGRRKYGSKKFQKMAVRGRKRKRRRRRK